MVSLEFGLVVSGCSNAVALFEQLIGSVVENLIVSGETFEKTVGILVYLVGEKAARLRNIQRDLLAYVVN